LFMFSIPWMTRWMHVMSGPVLELSKMLVVISLVTWQGHIQTQGKTVPESCQPDVFPLWSYCGNESLCWSAQPSGVERIRRKQGWALFGAMSTSHMKLSQEVELSQGPASVWADRGLERGPGRTLPGQTTFFWQLCRSRNQVFHGTWNLLTPGISSKWTSS
jgi:hypothetical protein